ncbi:hypothetical protein [Pseudonocardia sp. T1-2H]|uniref:hypothetical protein n=1 Tax=Pseudonocardia sp. T1-2H TaxID=3128899 RepID=UPI0031010D01
MENAWDDYLRWNSAICATVFSEDQAGRPVYLDMDDAVLAEVSSHLSIDVDEAQGQLVEAVRATLALHGGSADVFRAHLQHLDRWRRDVRRRSKSDSHVKPPPTLALLAAFTLAAEAMGSDRNVAVHAYYPRLAAVLGVTGDKPKERLQSAYQAAAEQLWRGLNDWLTLNDGRYGVPTAFALTHRYIGLPLSQALIRAADRRHLTRMFRQFGLPPGSDIPPADMARILDTWIQQVPCPASKNLQGLWQRTGAQERIAEVAATELASWDNRDATDPIDAGGTSAQPRTGDIRLMAQLRNFPKPALQLSFLATMLGASAPTSSSLRALMARRVSTCFRSGAARSVRGRRAALTQVPWWKAFCTW